MPSNSESDSTKTTANNEKHIALMIEDGEVLCAYVPNDGNNYIIHGKDFDHRTLEGADDNDESMKKYLELQSLVISNGLITDRESQKANGQE